MLETRGVWYSLESDMNQVIDAVDVVYLTQIRTGRLADESGKGKFAIDAATLQKMRPNAMILHPPPADGGTRQGRGRRSKGLLFSTDHERTVCPHGPPYDGVGPVVDIQFAIRGKPGNQNGNECERA